jgi:hypothetical protein
MAQFLSFIFFEILFIFLKNYLFLNYVIKFIFPGKSAKVGFMYFTKNLQIMGKMMPEMLKSFIDNGRNDELMGDAVKTVDMAEGNQT